MQKIVEQLDDIESQVRRLKRELLEAASRQALDTADWSWPGCADRLRAEGLERMDAIDRKLDSALDGLTAIKDFLRQEIMK